jgi:hypothetical protein
MNNQKPLPLISTSDCSPVPVFNCQVILSKPDDAGKRTGRVANLAGITAEGHSERDVLSSIKKQFKAAMQEYAKAQQAAPFLDPPELPQPGEVERFLPVHL